MINPLASSLHAGYFFMLLVSSADFFQKNAIRVSNSLETDQDQHSVSPDLGPTACKGYQQTTKVAASKERVKFKNTNN